MRAFREYLSKHNVRYTEPEMAESLDWIKRKIKQEVFMSSFGQQEGFKVLLEADPQVQKAVEAIPQARALYQNAKKIVAQRAGGPIEEPKEPPSERHFRTSGDRRRGSPVCLCATGRGCGRHPPLFKNTLLRVRRGIRYLRENGIGTRPLRFNLRSLDGAGRGHREAGRNIPHAKRLPRQGEPRLLR